MTEAVIIDAVRSPMGKGKPGGALSTVHPVELLSQTLSALLARTGIDPSEVEDVLTGCVDQVGEQASSPGRMAWLGAGLPEHVPATTVDRRCGSSQQAVHFAAQGVLAGVYDMVIACGVESMSRVPIGSARQDQDPHGPSVRARYAPGLVPQGVSAELIAAKWELGRERLDEYAAESHRRAAQAAESGRFDDEIVPIATPSDPGATVCTDETIRPGTTAERLGTLPPSFPDERMRDRFPQLEWRLTAGSSSQLTDGASAMLITSERTAQRLRLRPRARFRAFSVVGDDPIMMLTGPIPATTQVLKRTGLALTDIDHYEVNEAFASVPLAWQDELHADPERLNPRGGAIALGHPLGATGIRLMTTMLRALEDTGGRFGLQTMCESGGMANATIIERL